MSKVGIPLSVHGNATHLGRVTRGGEVGSAMRHNGHRRLEVWTHAVVHRRITSWLATVEAPCRQRSFGNGEPILFCSLYWF